MIINTSCAAGFTCSTRKIFNHLYGQNWQQALICCQTFPYRSCNKTIWMIQISKSQISAFPKLTYLCLLYKRDSSDSHLLCIPICNNLLLCIYFFFCVDTYNILSCRDRLDGIHRSGTGSPPSSPGYCEPSFDENLVIRCTDCEELNESASLTVLRR